MRSQPAQRSRIPRRPAAAVPREPAHRWRRALQAVTRRTRHPDNADQPNLRAGAEAPPYAPFEPRF